MKILIKVIITLVIIISILLFSTRTRTQPLPPDPCGRWLNITYIQHSPSCPEGSTLWPACANQCQTNHNNETTIAWANARNGCNQIEYVEQHAELDCRFSYNDPDSPAYHDDVILNNCLSSALQASYTAKHLNYNLWQYQIALIESNYQACINECCNN